MKKINPVIKYLNGTGATGVRGPILLVDSFRVLHPEAEVVGTFNGFRGQSDGSKIDYIFVTPDAHVSEATIMRTHRNGRYPSDHYPVTAKLSLPQNPAVTDGKKPNVEQSPGGNNLKVAPQE